jgi:hypothetical protein
MSSVIVNQKLRTEIRPLLKAAGFSYFTNRTYWRFRNERIDVINFQSFNSYNAEVLGCTTYSFAINLGCFLQCIPEKHIKQKDGQLLPEEYECKFRGMLEKRIEQTEFPRKSIWYIDPDLRYLDLAINDARAVLKDVGLGWFENFNNMSGVLRLLQSDEETNQLWGFGRLGSPNRNYCIGYVALSVGEQKLAAPHLKAAIESGCFKNDLEGLNSALEKCSS